MSMNTQLPFKISALVFVHNAQGQQLLIKRKKAPNQDCWSPIGGKLDMATGESPYECARRETEEEIGLQINDQDLHCFGYISEKSYEGTGHWLMFLFECKKILTTQPAEMEEGHFEFFDRSEIETLKIPETDRSLLWPYYDRYKDGFVGLRANCAPNGQFNLIEELQIAPTKA
jgi:8-oxo-dGTP diphosphatase